ncbi:MAG: thioredoxin family protein [Chitinophagaceae bacterium]|nr:thioredoxin family protein [Chitinophagaceae bacterium]MBL0334834.1 thioredoxin family protein [Chitinophagaceae bacterium]
MKRIVFALLFVAASLVCGAQDMAKFKLYSPEANAQDEIATAVKQAKQEGKHVLVQIGGNWCIWCARFYNFVQTDASLDSLMNANYVVYHLNWSKENKNESIMAKYKFPDRFGFPVFLVLDQEGNLIHTQNSSYLEEAKSYSKEKVAGFFADWSPAAIDPSQHKN